jgi:hypothetical protein
MTTRTMPSIGLPRCVESGPLASCAKEDALRVLAAGLKAKRDAPRKNDHVGLLARNAARSAFARFPERRGPDMRRSERLFFSPFIQASISS